MRGILTFWTASHYEHQHWGNQQINQGEWKINKKVIHEEIYGAELYMHGKADYWITQSLPLPEPPHFAAQHPNGLSAEKVGAGLTQKVFKQTLILCQRPKRPNIILSKPSKNRLLLSRGQRGVALAPNCSFRGLIPLQPEIRNLRRKVLLSFLQYYSNGEWEHSH